MNSSDPTGDATHIDQYQDQDQDPYILEVSRFVLSFENKIAHGIKPPNS